MTKKIAELKLTDKWAKNLIQDIEKTGYDVILEFDGMLEEDYIIAKKEEEEQE